VVFQDSIPSSNCNPWKKMIVRGILVSFISATGHNGWNSKDSYNCFPATSSDCWHHTVWKNTIIPNNMVKFLTKN
jgi:hypothetical protein